MIRSSVWQVWKTTTFKRNGSGTCSLKKYSENWKHPKTNSFSMCVAVTDDALVNILKNFGLFDNNSWFIRAAVNNCLVLDLKMIFISELNLSVLLYPKKIKCDFFLYNFALLNLNLEDLSYFITTCKDSLKIGGHIFIKVTFAV